MRRRLLWAALAVGLSLAAVEGVSAFAEWFVLPTRRLIATPAPVVRDDFPEFEAAGRTLRQQDPDWGARVPLADDPELGWALAPGLRFTGGGARFRVNDRGLRGPDLPAPRPGERRLVALGDSSVFGVGVAEDEVFLAVAAGVLARAWGAPVGSVNMGVPGFDTGQSLALLRRHGAAVAPAWVVVCNLWSDVYGVEKSPVPVETTYAAPLRRGFRRFATYRVLWRLLAPALNARRVGWITSREDIGGGSRPTRTSLSAYVANLRAIAAEAARLGARTAFVVLPAPMDQDAVPPPNTVQLFRAAMRRVAGEQGAPLLDGPALFERSDAGLGFFQDQVHPSVEGHRLLGVGLADLLREVGPAAGPG